MDTLHSQAGEEKPLSSPHSPISDQDRRAIPEPFEQRPERRMKTRLILIILAVVVVSLGIIIGVVMFTRPRTLTLTEADAGKTIQAHPGDHILLQLNENGSTGYSWAIDKTDTTILVLQRESSTPYPGIGSGSRAVYTFVAQRPGTVHLQMKYWRSWEGDSSIVKRYGVTVQVQGE